MLGRVWLRNASNGRVAWYLAAGALTAILALPSPVSAQVDTPKGVDQNRQAPAGAGQQQQQQSARPARSRTDILDLRDAASTSAMVAAPPPSPAGSEPLTVNAVVCIAGCDRGPGTVVYRDRPIPTLASLTELVPAPSALARGTIASTAGDASTLGSVLTCLAGCYEPQPLRTVASLRTQHAKASPPGGRAQQPSATDPVATAHVEPKQAPASPAAEATSVLSKPIKLRSGFAADGTSKTMRSARAKARMRTAAKRGVQYGKIIPVSQDKLKAARTPVDPKAAEPAATSEAAPANPPAPAPAIPVTTFAPQAKSEKNRASKTQPVTTVSNDWFNKINRQRKDDAAAKQQSDP